MWGTAAEPVALQRCWGSPWPTCYLATTHSSTLRLLLLPTAPSPRCRPHQDPTPIYRACAHLTSLVLSNNYALRPETLLPLFPAPPGEDSGSAALAPSLPSVACASASSLAPPATSRAAAQEPPLPGLQALDIGYCSMPAHVLAAVVLRAARLHVLSINGVRGGVTDALWPLLHLQAAARGTPRTPALPPPPPLACSTSGSDASAVVAAACALVGGAPAGAAATEAAAPEPSPPLLSHHALRTLCMIGSKELRSFCLGLVPADEALRLGLLIRWAGGAAGWVRHLFSRRQARQACAPRALRASAPCTTHTFPPPAPADRHPPAAAAPWWPMAGSTCPSRRCWRVCTSCACRCQVRRE